MGVGQAKEVIVKMALNREVDTKLFFLQCVDMTLEKQFIVLVRLKPNIKIHINMLVPLKSYLIGFLKVEFTHPDKAIGSRITLHVYASTGPGLA